MTRDQLLERLLTAYTSSYDIQRLETPDDHGLAATAHFHVDEESYMITRKAQMWATSSDEYVWFFTLPSLTEEAARTCIDYAYNEGMARIDPQHQKNHMVTRLVAIFLTDQVEDGGAKVVRTCRLYKSFQFSLKGWMEFHAVAADLSQDVVVNNGYGRETAKFVKKLLRPVKREGNGQRFWRIFKEMIH